MVLQRVGFLEQVEGFSGFTFPISHNIKTVQQRNTDLTVYVLYSDYNLIRQSLDVQERHGSDRALWLG